VVVVVVVVVCVVVVWTGAVVVVDGNRTSFKTGVQSNVGVVTLTASVPN
jgi:hypothetical protein